MAKLGNRKMHVRDMKHWHGSVGWRLTDRYGTPCGYVGLAYPCDSLEDGWRKGLEWLKANKVRQFSFLVRTFELKVRYF